MRFVMTFNILAWEHGSVISLSEIRIAIVIMANIS